MEMIFDDEDVRYINSSELLERFVLKTIFYKEQLSEHNEDSSPRSIRGKYLRETYQLREEINRRLKY